MAPKCEIFMNYSKKFMGICRKQIWLSKKEYLRDHRCERTNMAYKCKIFEAVTLTLHWHHTHMCRVSKAIDINTENKICLANKVYIIVHWL